MSDADSPWSAPPSGMLSKASSLPSNPKDLPSPKMPRTNDDLRASFLQSAEEYHRKQEAERQAGGQEQAQAASSPLTGGAGSPSLQDGGPVAPDFSGFIGKIEKDHAEIQQQLKSMHDKQEADDQQARNVAAGLQAFHDAWAVGSAKGNAIMSTIEGNIATAEGWREFDRNQDTGATKKDRDEDAGWREFKRNQDAGWREFDRTETSGEREQEKEERRRNSGMSL